MIYAKRFKTSGRISHYFKICQLVTGKYGISTCKFNAYCGPDTDNFIWNISLPLFDTQEKAEKYLKDNYEEVFDDGN